MRCKFCFATFQDVKRTILPKGSLPKEEAIRVVEELAEMGFGKITFAGGEPTLCPWLPELIEVAHAAGMTTMIVSNGSGIDEDFLSKNRNSLDWIALSIDSLNHETNKAIGRQMSSAGNQQLDYWSLAEKIKQHGYGLKINTVVNSANINEDMSGFIRTANPKRWKLLQVLPIKGQNDDKVDAFIISSEEFERFVSRHSHLSTNVAIVPESNEAILGSYAMVDPAGRFFDDVDGSHHYSQPILKVGARLAFQEVRTDLDKFIQRGGIYRWERPTHEKITLSGEVASGKTTIGKILAEKLNYDFISIGEETRRKAESLGLSIVEFQHQCLLNPELDRELDRSFSEKCNSRTQLVVDYRLGFHFVRDSYHIFLRISKKTAIDRMKKAGRSNETFHTIKQRNDSFREQFLKAHNVDYTNPNRYHLVVNVEEFANPDEIAEYIMSELRGYRHGKSENVRA